MTNFANCERGLSQLVLLVSDNIRRKRSITIIGSVPSIEVNTHARACTRASSRLCSEKFRSLRDSFILFPPHLSGVPVTRRYDRVTDAMRR